VAEQQRVMANETPSDTVPTGAPPAGRWRAVCPPVQWLPAYRPQWLAYDAVAGVILAAYAIPVSLAYASLAGLPAQYGTYCYLVGGLAYAFFGTSRQLAVGPTSATPSTAGLHGSLGGSRGRAPLSSQRGRPNTNLMCRKMLNPTREHTRPV